MARVLVVSQPMFIPWIGLFEQARLADVFVHYDDVQLPRGRSFMSRVQIKSVRGVSWLGAPINHIRSGRLINQIVLFDGEDWRGKHLETLRHAYARAPYFKLMFDIAQRIYHNSSERLAEFNIAAFEEIAHWLGLKPQFLRSSEMAASGASSDRLVDLCELTAADIYVTGHGARNYLDHDKFERAGITVRYMNYQKLPYAQWQTEFTPYVSILDAIAHHGDRVRDLVCSDSVHWREFLAATLITVETPASAIIPIDHAANEIDGELP